MPGFGLVRELHWTPRRQAPTIKRGGEATTSIGESRVAHTINTTTASPIVAHTVPPGEREYRAFLYLARTAYGALHTSSYQPASRTTLTAPRTRNTASIPGCRITRSYGTLAGLQAFNNTVAVPLYTLHWLCEWPLHVLSHRCRNSHSQDTLN